MNFNQSLKSRISALEKQPPNEDEVDPDPKARGPRETPHCGADQLWWRGWRRSCLEPARPIELSPAALGL